MKAMALGLLATLPLLAGVALSSSWHEGFDLVAQSVDQELHRRCLDAKDYAGCVQSNGGRLLLGQKEHLNLRI